MSNWIFVEEYSQKYQGYVWRVKREKDGVTEHGYFKFLKRHNIPYAGPMVANEMIAVKLGELVKLPMHKLEYATVNGMEGVVSIVKNVPFLTRWDQLPNHVYENIPKYFKSPKHLINMFVFDVWTCNTDRGTNKNMIVYKDETHPKYQIYLIDHNHCLHDANLKWEKHKYNEPYWDQIHRYYRPPSGVGPLVRQNLGYVRRCIQRIESISSLSIRKIIHDVPKQFVTESERLLIYNLLIHRQKKLSFMISEWVKRRE
ncbi:hypothetical protein L1765_04855 [Microaerobacter geothermalis]|uniref:HipA family kinase n=1 Tax=Microaerobacter geothermalis TaxID=674972 RepID=UPI001F25E644|nr:HipA family kinase [Microaerobacter geothermalis]MCF6093325.1 hypothetical protein [Microaerobacter geothermalis]